MGYVGDRVGVAAADAERLVVIDDFLVSNQWWLCLPESWPTAVRLRRSDGEARNPWYFPTLGDYGDKTGKRRVSSR